MSQAYRVSDVALTIPEGWVERSLVGFSAPALADRPVTPNVLVAISDVPPGEALGGFVDRQVADLRQRAQGFDLLLRRDVRLDGDVGVEVVFRWLSGEAGLIRQRQLYVLRPGDRVVSITQTAGDDEFAACDAVFLEILREFAWTDPSGDGFGQPAPVSAYQPVRGAAGPFGAG